MMSLVQFYAVWARKKCKFGVFRNFGQHKILLSTRSCRKLALYAESIHVPQAMPGEFPPVSHLLCPSKTRAGSVPHTRPSPPCRLRLPCLVLLAGVDSALPYNQLPVLELDGVTQLPQSFALLRFAGKLAGTYCCVGMHFVCILEPSGTYQQLTYFRKLRTMTKRAQERNRRPVFFRDLLPPLGTRAHLKLCDTM